MARLAYRCFAKVNLTLEVLFKREDGYHELASLVHTISLADELRIEPAPELVSRVDGLELVPEANLVTRAACLLASTVDIEPQAELVLVKRIPAAAGLGGGSSDAATALVGLNTVWDTRLDGPQLAGLGAALGADVPFFVRGGAAVMRGRGDALEDVPPLTRQWLVLVVPPHGLVGKTARLYAALDPHDFSSGESTDRTAARLREGLPPVQEDLVNAFSRAARAVFPGLADVWTTVERVCERRFFLSGAGPALFALANNRADAQHQQARLARVDVMALTAHTVRHARTPIGYP